MDKLFWSGTPILESVGEHEPFVKDLKDSVRCCIRQALIPLKAYARRYNNYTELVNLEVNEYIR